MHMRWQLSFLIVVALLSCTTESFDRERQVDNLVAFAKTYGYVRYFHPSDASLALDWDAFARYGSAQVVDCRNEEELRGALGRLFAPIASTLVIAKATDRPQSSALTLSPDTSYVFWQHRGVQLDLDTIYETYKSRRASLRAGEIEDGLFNVVPKLNVIHTAIGGGLTCYLPLVLSQSAARVSSAQADSLRVLAEALTSITFEPQDRSSRLGNAIITYNVIQHFWPYFDVVDVDWDAELRRALDASLEDAGGVDYVNTLRRMTAALRDGHVTVTTNEPAFYPPIYWEWIKDTLVITKVMDSAYSSYVGSIVTGIDGMSVEDYFEDIWPTISAGTKGWLEYRSQREALGGVEGSSILIAFYDRLVPAKRTVDSETYYEKIKLYDIASKTYPNDIAYVNLERISDDEFEALLPTLERAHGIIFDLRGYPWNAEIFLNYLLRTPDTALGWMQVPQFMSPDHEGPISYEYDDWVEWGKPAAPYLGDKPIVILTDGRAISAAESYAAYFKYYGLALVMGQPTAGANGSVNLLKLPGEIELRFTGTRTLKLDGGQLHAVGHLPDVYLSRSIDAVGQGRDEYIEAALKYLTRQD